MTSEILQGHQNWYEQNKICENANIKVSNRGKMHESSTPSLPPSLRSYLNHVQWVGVWLGIFKSYLK